MLKDLLERWMPPGNPRATLRQSGAIPYTVIDNRVVFLLVTSRKTGRWIFPKGGISSGMTPWDSAAKEAFEEAGVVGEVGREALGSYRNDDKGFAVEIDLYPMRVTEQFDAWQEKGQRLRHWALLAETRRLLADRALVRLAEGLHRQVSPVIQ